MREVALVAPAKVGRNLLVFTTVTLERQFEDLLESFERRMLAQPEVIRCYLVSGDADYLVIVTVPDMVAYNAFARRVFANEPNMRMLRSTFALSVVKYDTKISLDEEGAAPKPTDQGAGCVSPKAARGNSCKRS